MVQVSEQMILETLGRVTDKERGGDIVSLGMVSGLNVLDGNVFFAIEVDPQRGSRMEPLRQEAEDAIKAIPGVESATVVLTAERDSSPQPQPEQGQHHGHAHGPDAVLLPDVKAIIAVASGKGGVGKSTVAANLSVALSQLGMSVGLLDADIYGPSMPRMMGIKGEPSSSDGKTINPMEAHGIKVMSIGFLVEEETPIIWRGPMVMSALEQLMRDVAWGTLDVLVVDMPPGTGDAQLTMAQRVPLAGAVIVSTPQDIALADARKGLNMFRRTNVPVLGLVENMSYFVCPHCGERTEIFSHGGARREAEMLSMDFLGEVPLDMAIRETSDGGTPIVAADPQSPHAQAFLAIAGKVKSKLETLVDEQASEAPKIVIQ